MKCFIGLAKDMTGANPESDAVLESAEDEQLALQILPDDEDTDEVLFTALLTQAEYDRLKENGAEEI